MTGDCHRGAVQLEAPIDPHRIGICHCTNCQTFSGSAFRTSVLVTGKDFQLIKGNPSTNEKRPETENQES